MAARVGFLAIHFLLECLYFFVGLVLARALTAFTGRGILDFQSYGQPKGLNILPALWLHFMF